MAEPTVLDAPETPAPVFAFRALKYAVFGSPDDNHDRNKENPPALSSKETNPSSSLRSKISALRIIPLASSPTKRRKMLNQNASPAKSILRTPGIPTPRKQATNVTFKDATPSLSPELTFKQPAAQAKEQVLSHQGVCGKDGIASQPLHPPKVQPPTSPKQTVTAKAETQLPSNNSENRKALASPPQPSTSPFEHDPSAPFDIEAYKATTEREVKRLMRYGQKMRDYARKQDEENTGLKIALERLQKENEELQRRWEATEREGQAEAGRGTMMATGQTMHKQERMDHVSQRHDDGKVTTHATGTTAQEKSRKDGRVSSSSGIATKASTGSNLHEKPGTQSTITTTRTLSSPLKRKASTQLTRPAADTESTARGAHSTHIHTHSHNFPSRAISFHNNKQPQQQLHPTKTTATSGADLPSAPAEKDGSVAFPAAVVAPPNLPPERVAAVRERLRIRREARKMTVGSG